MANNDPPILVEMLYVEGILKGFLENELLENIAKPPQIISTKTNLGGPPRTPLGGCQRSPHLRGFSSQAGALEGGFLR